MKRPVVRIVGETGSDLLPAWGSSLMSVTFTDNSGGDADELEFQFSVTTPLQAPPQKGQQYRLLFNWQGEALRDAGLFTFQSASLSFEAEGGWTMSVVSRSADFVDADKAADVEHFEETTAGEIFRQLAEGVGKKATVHPVIDAIPIPYRLRMQQSAVGFAQQLADELGATLKLANGQWLVPLKNSGQTALGSTLPPIVISADEATGCDLTTEGRPEFAEVRATWFDEEKGLPALAVAKGSGRSAAFFGLHSAPSASEAKQRSQAERKEMESAAITGSVSLEGRAGAIAGAPVELVQFGGWSGFDLVAQTITHTFTFDESGGWLMSIELSAKGEASAAG